MKKIVFLIIGVLLIVISSVILLNRKDGSKPKDSPKKSIKVDIIEKYGYKLFDDKSDVYAEKFEELKKVLKEEVVDEEAYAKLLAELFVIDFYDLNSKVSNTDIGGLDYVHPKAKDAFLKTAIDGMYKFVESNVYGGRKQELPVVSDAKAEVTTFDYKGTTLQDEKAYKAVVDISYKKDLKYPTKVTVTLVHESNKLFVVVVE